jgi:hypothetical protein
MKSALINLVILLFPLFLSAATIGKKEAEKASMNFFRERLYLSGKSMPETLAIRDTKLVCSSTGESVYYIVHFTTGGFCLVSAQDNVIPVLAYAFEGNFNTGHCNVASWMSRYEDEIVYTSRNKVQAAESIRSEWNRLTNNNFTFKAPGTITSVSPLLVSKWNQDSYYNELCPEDPAGPDGHCYAGCVATAMGQLLYYYRFPYQGQGSYTYVHPVYDTISADFGATTYDWNGMPSSISKSNLPIATLLHHQGVSVDMDYGPDGSGMWNHKAAYSLKTYFRCGPETQYYFRDSISLDWDSILVANLDLRKPLYYAGWAGVQSNSGHAFVCDGYQDTTYFHFNWGWGGSSDGYFYLNNLTPGGSNFNYAQEVIPLFPDTIQNVYPNYCSGRTQLHGIRGSVEDGSGWADYHPNSSCSWLIHPQDPDYDSIRYLKLTFTKMNTEAGNDMVYVYDGDTTTAPLLGMYSGNTIPPVISSTGDKLLIVFETNAVNNFDGWQADYEAIIPVYCSGMTTLNSPEGYIEDGSGNKKYNNNTFCRWKITPIDAGSVTFNFSNFDLADTNDVLRIYSLPNLELIAELTGSQLPSPVSSMTGKMLITFISNKSTTCQGFDGYYTSSLVGTRDREIPGNKLYMYPNPAKDFLHVRYASHTDGELKISLINPVASLKLEEKFRVHTGENIVTINTRNLPSSIYFVSVITEDNQQIFSKIVIE